MKRALFFSRRVLGTEQIAEQLTHGVGFILRPLFRRVALGALLLMIVDAAQCRIARLDVIFRQGPATIAARGAAKREKFSLAVRTHAVINRRGFAGDRRAAVDALVRALVARAPAMFTEESHQHQLRSDR